MHLPGTGIYIQPGELSTEEMKTAGRILITGVFDKTVHNPSKGIVAKILKDFWPLNKSNKPVSYTRATEKRDFLEKAVLTVLKEAIRKNNSSIISDICSKISLTNISDGGKNFFIAQMKSQERKQPGQLKCVSCLRPFPTLVSNQSSSVSHTDQTSQSSSHSTSVHHNGQSVSEAAQVRLLLAEALCKLNSEQIAVTILALEGKNVEILGEAGTGKSFLLKFLSKLLKLALNQQQVILNILRDSKFEEWNQSQVEEHLSAVLPQSNHSFKVLGVSAMTGMAAEQNECATLHSLLGLGLATGSVEQILNSIRNNRKIRERWTSMDCLILDEVGMLGDELAGKIHLLACELRGSVEPFGGLQWIVFGDVCQLPAVNMDFFFASPYWKAAFPMKQRMVLRQVFRQNGNYLDHLRQVRQGR